MAPRTRPPAPARIHPAVRRRSWRPSVRHPDSSGYSPFSLPSAMISASRVRIQPNVSATGARSTGSAITSGSAVSRPIRQPLSTSPVAFEIAGDPVGRSTGAGELLLGGRLQLRAGALDRGLGELGLAAEVVVHAALAGFRGELDRLRAGADVAPLPEQLLRTPDQPLRCLHLATVPTCRYSGGRLTDDLSRGPGSTDSLGRHGHQGRDRRHHLSATRAPEGPARQLARPGNSGRATTCGSSWSTTTTRAARRR